MKYREKAEDTPENLAHLERYDTHIRKCVGEDYRWRIRMRHWELYEVLQRLPEPGELRLAGPVLDTGAYNTYFGLYLTLIADDVVISDLYRLRVWKSLLRQLRLAPPKKLEAKFQDWFRVMRRAGPRGRLKSVDLTAIDYPDDHFELVTSISVIEHIPEVEKAIAEMYRVLKPGGRLLITTDSAEQPVPYHEGVRYFSHEELKTMFSPYPVTSPWREPDYAKENWGYTYAPGVVQCFVEITKPAG